MIYRFEVRVFKEILCNGWVRRDFVIKSFLFTPWENIPERCFFQFFPRKWVDQTSYQLISPSANVIKPRSRRLGGFLLCLRFIYFFFLPRSRRRARSCFAFGLLNRAAVGWAVSCSAFGLFFFFVLSVTISKPLQMMSHSANCHHRMMSSSANYGPFLSSFRHTPPQEHFVKLAN